MLVRVTSTALGALALSRFRPFPAAWTSGPASTAVPHLRVFENYWSHSCETPWRPFLVPVKKKEISERESIQEFPENRSDRFSRRLVLSLKVNSICCFFWVFGREGGQDRIPTLLLSPKAAQLLARPPGGTQYGKITGSRTKRLRYSGGVAG